MTDLAKNFGKRLREIRAMRGLTQAGLAELAEVETMTVSRIETGLNFPKKENIEIFAKVLNVDIQDFFDFGNFKSKRDLIDDINNMLEKASISDVKFCQKVIFSYFERSK